MAFSMLGAGAIINHANAANIPVPTALTRLVDAVRTIARTPATPNTDPLAALVDAVTDGTLTDTSLTKLIDAAALDQTRVNFRNELGRRAESAFMARFHRELRDGAADAILDAARPKFDAAIKGIASAAERIDPGVSADQFLATADAAGLKLWQGLNADVTTANSIAQLAALFAPGGSAELIKRPGGPSLGELANWIHPRAVMCSTSDIDLFKASELFHKRDGQHRQSVWFRLTDTAQLNTIDAARERFRAWAEHTFDAHQAAAPKHYRSVDGELIEREPQPNPYRLEDATPRSAR
ncbi:hypothetical protein H7J07_16720 [Mycobacterium koreense]|uniref:Uncharacterized protein n=1 Tax=Mycolicibacillus koreensis TaxID=1069220 RepID=A0A7I7S7U0_9MYCO|nr:hypothetical protein [Mycolicibacillus koreensis]MCV7249846.1 hypothetical protein [Mycolicibacillus koreensis]OSC25100.1 hypothetical protein B8W67_19185 [Mycolicibacillus koreensis]BBY52942.1 hypothetical protein MKOR_01930 [Mycolicibacillus koreensis]